MKIPTEPIPLEHLVTSCTSDMATVAKLVEEWFEARNEYRKWKPCEGLFAVSKMPTIPTIAPRSSPRVNAPAISDDLEEVKQAHIEAVIADSPTLAAAAHRLGINSASIYRRRRALKIKEHPAGQR